MELKQKEESAQGYSDFQSKGLMFWWDEQEIMAGDLSIGICTDFEPLLSAVEGLLRSEL